MVVIVIIPVAIGVPAVTVGVPPTAVVFPTIVAGFCEFVSRMRGLLALPTVMLDGLVQPVIGVPDSLVAIVCFRARHSSEKRQSARQRPVPKTNFQLPRGC